MFRQARSVFYKPVSVGSPTSRASKLQSFSTGAATSASYRPTKRPSDASWNDELANYLAAECTNGAGRKVNAVGDRLGEVSCAEASRLLPRESSSLHTVLDFALSIYPVRVNHRCKPLRLTASASHVSTVSRVVWHKLR